MALYVVENEHPLHTFHAGQMLDSARDTNGDVKFWGNNFTSLTNLHVVWYVTGINCSTRSADTSAQLICQGIKNSFEILTIFKSTATRYNLELD